MEYKVGQRVVLSKDSKNNDWYSNDEFEIIRISDWIFEGGEEKIIITLNKNLRSKSRSFSYGNLISGYGIELAEIEKRKLKLDKLNINIIS